MTWFMQLTDPGKLPPDSVIRASIMQKIERLSDMSGEEIFRTIATWTVQLVGKIILALIIYYVGRWLIKRLLHLLGAIFERREVDVSLASFLRNLVEIVLMIVLISIVVGVLGISTTSFMAIFASAGLAVGMALSGTLQNFAGGVMILLLKPYRIGDYIEAQGQAGTVKEIRLFNTIINTPDNKMIIIPNNSISTSIINNYSKENRRRIDLNISISYGDDFDVARAAFLEILDNDPRVLFEQGRQPLVALTNLGDSAVVVLVRFWVKSSDYWDAYFAVNEAIYKQLPEKGIHFPFPQLDVRIAQ
ncbi:MAG: mechanosensitive ion channel family protein [Rikenellaceae bacterium]|nr:mechanosensitive ion channel family protein [Rikenellaceae bacterium]